MAFVATLTGTGRNCTLTSGSATMTVSSAVNLVVGATIQGTGIQTGTRINSISGTTVVMSQAATASGTQSLIFSSVYGSTLTIQLTASGDVATWQNVFNAGYGFLLGTKNLFHPGALTVTFGTIVAGARFDHENWTVEFGAGGRMLFDSGLLAGEQRGGYDIAGSLLVKSAGPTFVFTSWNNSTPGGSSMFINTGGSLTMGGLFRMHNPRFVLRAGVNNTAFAFVSARDNMDVENPIFDYSEATASNSGIGIGYGTVLNPKVIFSNSSLSRPNSTSIGEVLGLQFLGLFQDSPAAKFAIPNNYVMESYAPLVTNAQTIGGFQANTTETFANIDLSSPGWGLNDLKTKYLRFGGTNVINFPRRVSFQFNDSAGDDLTDVTLFIRSGANTILNEVQSGDYSKNTQALVLTWNTVINSYRVANVILDTINQVAQVRKFGYIEQSTSYSLNNQPYSQPFFLLTDTVAPESLLAATEALTTVSVDFVNKVVNVTGAATLREAYAKCKLELSKVANSSVPNFLSSEGTSFKIFGGWTFSIASTGSLNTSDELRQLEIDGEQIVIASGGVVNVPFRDIDGLRVTVTGLDPEAFGIEWYLRYKLQSNSSYTEVDGTGNVALLLVSDGVYDVQARVKGYDWTETVLNTSEGLSLNLGLRFQQASDGTAQYLKPFDAAIADIFQFDAGSGRVSAENTTGDIITAGFPEMYRAFQRITHLPDLVWTFTDPVRANSVTQSFLIPTGNPTSLFLTANSDNHVRLTSPVVLEETGEAAYSRITGNMDGFQIILGSPATAESAGLVEDVIRRLTPDLEVINKGVQRASIKRPHLDDI
jgi:hypothetical protein